MKIYESKRDEYDKRMEKDFHYPTYSLALLGVNESKGVTNYMDGSH
jgi:hypothetical protein